LPNSVFCFSTGIPQNLKVLPVASKGSVESNRETGTKRCFRPLDVFPGLLVFPKCICSQGSVPKPRLKFRPFSPHECPQDKLMARPMVSTIKIDAKGSASKKRLKTLTQLKPNVPTHCTVVYHNNFIYNIKSEVTVHTVKTGCSKHVVL